MLRDGLDADEMIGSEVVAADGSRIGAVTDLLVDADGAITHAAVDAGQALGMGSRHVAVDLARLQRTEDEPEHVQARPGRTAARRIAHTAKRRPLGPTHNDRAQSSPAVEAPCSERMLHCSVREPD